MSALWLFALYVVNALPDYYGEHDIINQPVLLDWINYAGNADDGRVQIGAKLKFAGNHSVCRKSQSSAWYARIAGVHITKLEYNQILPESFDVGFV